ncbi:ferredoxin [Mycolicibacterium pulveris]|uniref:Ferredoxin FdxD n=1 Tax=Mycolicibacterium pulveris TaxID=36813 RepID=A0A7I7UE89_MYCPV|nr:ferredoxin [Mycolicibacterium pulveris]MCV6979205.1 ferredoxin [Mycolicibacterium pulveris]BBY79585.1 ferredoxin FdxD [Mycolicibacterium pulveris]
MRVVVDLDLCEGNAFCVNIAPAVFELSDDEYSVVKVDPIPVDQEALVTKAIEACPRQALSRRD